MRNVRRKDGCEKSVLAAKEGPVAFEFCFFRAGVSRHVCAVILSCKPGLRNASEHALLFSMPCVSLDGPTFLPSPKELYQRMTGNERATNQASDRNKWWKRTQHFGKMVVLAIATAAVLPAADTKDAERDLLLGKYED